MFRRAACRVLYVICKRKYEGQCGYRQLTRQTVVSRAAGEARHGSTSTRIPDMNVTESPDTTTTSPKHTAVLTSKSLTATGLRQTDPRLYQATHNFLALTQAQLEVDGEDLGAIDRKTFKECVKDNIIIIGRAFRNEFVVPEFRKFTGTIDQLYWKCRNNRAGKVADYIPQLSRFSPDYWGISLCTVDGQRYTVGDSGIPFCLQSCSKALTYGLALSELGPDIVHEFVGQEPSGHSFNELRLDPQRKPHNPMINAGAIVTASLIKSDFKLADRFDYVLNQYRRLAGGEFIGFNNATFLSERETADRNFALGYYMKEHKCFPEGVNLMETMDFYFQLCSIEVNCESGSVMAATLANGGICPITGDRVFDAASVRNTLSLMYSCGMYDYSGQFAFQVGLPAKSGVSGAILLVVPNVMGICCWSPSLDELGNSCRGLQFCQELVKIFNFHNYDNLKHTVKKVDPRIRTTERRGDEIVGLLFGASKGDLSALRRMALSGIDMQQADYDGRTALHLAAAEGHMTCVEFLLDKCKVAHDPKDRWGHTPLDDAQRFERNEVVEVLERYEEGLENVQNLNKEKNEPDYEE